MRLWTKLMVPVLMLGLAGVADAKGTRKHANHEMKGKIVSISGTDLTVVPHHHKKMGEPAAKSAEKTKTLHTTAQTAITVDGVGGKLVTDLAAGQKVRVRESSGTATSITATTKHHHKKKK